MQTIVAGQYLLIAGFQGLARGRREGACLPAIQ
jgi:hypothetical protein